MKQRIDKTNNDLTSYEADVEKVVKKGYPLEMKTYYNKKLKQLEEALAPASDLYAKEAIKTDKSDDIGHVQEVFKAVEAATGKLDEATANFAKNTGADLKKLAA